jgi:YidC/Oxa1 family membrane protein insertase
MNSEKQRVMSFVLITFASIMAVNLVMERAGLIPKEKPPVAQAAGKEKGLDKVPAAGKEAAKADLAKGQGKSDLKTAAGEDKAKDQEKGKPGPPAVALAKPEELILGSTQPKRPIRDKDPTDYHLEVALDQKGAGVASVGSALFDAEREEGKPDNRPLQIVRYDPLAPPSLSITIRPPAALAPKVTTNDEDPDEVAKIEAAAREAEVTLEREVWEVVRDDKNRAVRPVTSTAEKTGAKLEGQEAVFRTRVDQLDLTVTKTYRLFKGRDAFEVELKFEGTEKTPKFGYRLMGPHGIPVEGLWYTGTFRDAVFGQVDGRGTKVVTLSAYDIAKAGAKGEKFEKLPLKFAGVENQYFTTFVEPFPTPRSDTDRVDAESRPIVLHENEDKQKSDIGVEILSRPLVVGPNAPVSHAYQVFAGPKTYEALAPYGAEELGNYRKSNFIPFATFFARALITPLLGWTYQATEVVARVFGGTHGNYGVAIILLTLLVRLLMFPLGRKAAIAAKKMQDLQPLLKEIQTKYKDDKEAVTRETFALYRKHGVNPVGGCLPALIQLPIFVGLWQALNNSVYLRHAKFLYIQNLAAPDMLFKFPVELPFLGQYFNLLPFLVVALMLVQTKLFAPPATTPEAEMQQKMMKYMMVFMAFMFYKVPSGLGIYFITSSLWQIGERLLLPKVTTGIAPVTDDGKSPPDGNGGGRGSTPPAPAKPPGALSQLWKKVLDEATKDPTYRKLTEERDKNRSGDRGNGPGSGPDRDRGKPRARPGKRR